MQFSVPCATYVRLSGICSVMPADEPAPYLRSLFVERKHGRLLAIATNKKLLAVELIEAKSAGPDEHCFVEFNDALLAQAEREIPFSSRIDFDAMPELGVTTAKTMYGYSHPGNVGVFPTESKVWTPEWRNWFPDELPKESYGQMEWNASQIACIAEASPSGDIVFPTHIDTRVPCVVRDASDPNFIALFFPHLDVNKRPPPLRIPTW